MRCRRRGSPEWLYKVKVDFSLSFLGMCSSMWGSPNHQKGNIKKKKEREREREPEQNSGKKFQTNILNYFLSFPRQCHYTNLKESDPIHFLFVVASPMNTWWFWITELPAVALLQSVGWRVRRGLCLGSDRLCTSSCVSCFNSVYFELSSFWSSGRVRKMSILPASRAGCQSSRNDLLWQMAMALGYVGGLQPSDG